MARRAGVAPVKRAVMIRGEKLSKVGLSKLAKKTNDDVKAKEPRKQK